MTSRSESRRRRVVRAAYRFGWRHGGRLPEPVVRVVSTVAARVVVAQDGLHVRRLAENLTVLSGRPADRALVRAGIVSYLRTLWEVLALPRWTTAEAVARVDLVNGPTVWDAFTSTGAVIALPHSGNWDLAGAWACGSGMGVTSVAEALPPDEYAAFLAFREGLGMEILSHRDPDVIDTLVAAVGRGRLVCLLADRNLSGRGVEVDLAGRRVTMPVGPALVARRSGAALIPTVAHYDRAPLRRTSRMRLVLGPVVPNQEGEDGLVAMVQACADFFTAMLCDHAEDWHVLQPFFDLPARPARPAGAAAWGVA